MLVLVEGIDCGLGQRKFRDEEGAGDVQRPAACRGRNGVSVAIGITGAYAAERNKAPRPGLEHRDVERVDVDQQFVEDISVVLPTESAPRVAQARQHCAPLIASGAAVSRGNSVGLAHSIGGTGERHRRAAHAREPLDPGALCRRDRALDLQRCMRLTHQSSCDAGSERCHHDDGARGVAPLGCVNQLRPSRRDVARRERCEPGHEGANRLWQGASLDRRSHRIGAEGGAKQRKRVALGCRRAVCPGTQRVSFRTAQFRGVG